MRSNPVAGPRPADRGIPGLMPDQRTLILVSHGDEASLRIAGSCALAATAMGDRVDVFLFGPALSAVVAAREEGEGGAGFLHQARASGTCRLFGCSASLVAEKVDPAAAEQALDAVIGWPTILEWSRGVVNRFCF
jgi:predicted peroxiredoxin